ncbi:MurR/RpiR family transcriptional regulator [Lactiplantibacillus pentosus]|jgi:transcriptional regulator with XRE-family HTH domain|uniref:HTH rpiR-type domain-containing protein n=2 Tax=Lactiplantibacillus pentosus TaxID=1589 RepID=A0A837RAL5_LACPE|nr:MurR/RpiR family transcriptional regulator [Lactiplantibacillus pentosus]AYJ43060.1 MurR/RpiR family transcriptional regulator [Lactiplantibacillus pentosus]KRK25337.1 hypothetical protein FD24_GL003185 [Lactiplantibacillus pentosus DSM 20314]MBU7495767.1 MurR/RpiR family transcriptional regulator [Lactiplantibacillus pentosus]MCT3297231.1 MurR/RpiR family transcriptional regulator [Lactiplantibacillus pentosus]MCT3298519.1 MurR/RpiR family transcriptional regulator [Lactiplantibacillus pen
MDNTLYNILYKLSNELDTKDPESTNFILSAYLLKNFATISEVSIYDIAAECNVSRSTIRRFAKQIGFENFAVLKKLIKQYHHPVEQVSDKKYREMLTNSLINIANELDERMDTHEVDVICERIRRAENVYIFTSEPSISSARDFQVNLASKGYISYVITDFSEYNTILNQISHKDYVLTLSVSGMFARTIDSVIARLTCILDLITANRIFDYEKDYSHVYYMSHLDYSKNPEIYRSYGLHYFLDIIQNHL